MLKRIIRNAPFLFALPLLAACEGWEMQLTDTVFPYGNMRTAGSGVMYVRAQMLPEKELKVMPVERPREPEVMAPAPQEEVKSMEPVFHDKMKK